MWTRSSRLRRRVRHELTDHRARLAEIDGRLRAARAMHAEMERWPPPLACWLRLQRGQAVASASAEDNERPRMDLTTRRLPQVIDPNTGKEPEPWVQTIRDEATRRAQTYGPDNMARPSVKRWGP